MVKTKIMLLSKATLAVLLLGVVASAEQGAPAQTRLNLSGTWTRVPDKTSPDNSMPAATFTIAQEGQKLTISPTPAGNTGSLARTYLTDGEEHPTVRDPLRTKEGNATPAPMETTYRAAWTRDQLVITVKTQWPGAAADAKNARTVVTRQVYSIDGDGQLIIEASVVSASIPTKSNVARIVYRKN